MGGLDHANKANSEGLKSIKRYQGQLRETIQLFEDEARAKAQITEQVGISERKAASLSGEIWVSRLTASIATRSSLKRTRLAWSLISVMHVSILKSAEQDRADKDDQIKTLKDEIAHQADMISKLGKDKRSVGDGRQKTEEDIQAAEDKCNHLSKVKGKLEQCLDESEDALEREKKVKGDVEKAKRKIEGDLEKRR